MTEELSGAITSDKIETDDRGFATVRADQTVEELLIPRSNAFRQLNWDVTIEKGAVYKPTEEVGIYAREVDCKYGVQIDGTVFGRSEVSIEHGGAVHSGDGDERTIGARVFGSVLSHERIEVVAAGSRLDDWEPRPVTVYGDVLADHVSIEEPTVVYGNVVAESTLRVSAPTVVVGDVHSGGVLEATELFAFSVSAVEDLTLGGDVAVVNPTVVSAEGTVTIAEPVGVFAPGLLERVREHNDVDVIGPWVFDVDEIWEREALHPVDVTDHGDGQAASRSWRTVSEPAERYASARELYADLVATTRKDPPDVERFRYAGVESVGGGTRIEGDLVVGSQEKVVDETDVTEIDRSTTEVDRSTEVHDESTTVEDSVVNRSDIGDGDDEGGDG